MSVTGNSPEVNIAIDHDGTFSLLPEVWTKAIALFREAGANVFCITSRFPNVPITGMPVPVFYTCGQPKWEWAYENGVQVDIWIDDMPSCIGDHPELRGREPGQAAQRRAIIKQLFSQLKFA